MRSPGQNPQGFPVSAHLHCSPLSLLHHYSTCTHPAQLGLEKSPWLSWNSFAKFHNVSLWERRKKKKTGSGCGGKKKGEERRPSREADVKSVCPWEMLPLRLWASLFRLRMEDWIVCLLHSPSNSIHIHSPEGSLLLRVILKVNAMGCRLVLLLRPG